MKKNNKSRYYQAGNYFDEPVVYFYSLIYKGPVELHFIDYRLDEILKMGMKIGSRYI